MIYYYTTAFGKMQAFAPHSGKRKSETREKIFMSFAAFSKDFGSNMFTSVENQFITKYLPQADGDAVRVYLYGLYLCQVAGDFDAATCAKLLKLSEQKLVEIFSFWEECDLVRILSREPLFVEYLPVNAAAGRPKTVRPEKYAAFNRELYQILQRAKKDFKPYEMQRILEFLENNPMEQQAFLLVAEYCAKKDGEKLSCSHVLNKAAKLVRERKFTYEQVEADLADYHTREKELSRLFTLLGIYRKPQEADYAYLEKWTALGMEEGATAACAEALGKGSLSTLDALVTELHEKGAHSEQEARDYLLLRKEQADAVYKVARKLGVKVQNPRTYCEEYAEKWLERGYDGESLTLLAALALKLSYGFPEFDAMLDNLYAAGIVDEGSVREYCAARDRQLRLLQKIQTACGVIRKTQAALDMIETWRSWNFSDEMILEAAKRASGAATPLPYMNKLLSEWKREGISSPAAIPEQSAPATRAPFKSEAAISADARSERERWYAARRRKAVARAEQAAATAEKDEAYARAESAIKKGEIELAKAEVFAPDTLPAIRTRLEQAKAARAAAMKRLHLTDADFVPEYACSKCSDTGFLPDGRMCDCYRPNNP